jgi:hypothetical protein
MSGELIDYKLKHTVEKIKRAVDEMSRHAKALAAFRDNNNVYHLDEINARYLYKTPEGRVNIWEGFLADWGDAQRLLMTCVLAIHCAMCDIVRPRGGLVSGAQLMLSPDGIWIKSQQKLNGVYNYTIHANGFTLLAFSTDSGILELVHGEATVIQREVEAEVEAELAAKAGEEVEVKEKVYVDPPMTEYTAFFEDLRIITIDPDFVKLNKKLYTPTYIRREEHVIVESIIRQDHLNADGSDFNPAYLEQIRDPDYRRFLRLCLRLYKFFMEYGYCEDKYIHPNFKKLVDQHQYRIKYTTNERGFSREDVFVEIKTPHGWVYIKSTAVVSGKAYVKKEKVNLDTDTQSSPPSNDAALDAWLQQRATARKVEEVKVQCVY